MVCSRLEWLASVAVRRKLNMEGRLHHGYELACF